MATHRSIDISRRIYARLLVLYPAGHRAEYGADLLQLFTDQCQDAARSRQRLAFLSLWLRTLGDLAASALREHLVSPHSWAGLLEAAPNAPLPWKGVALVLLPGLIFFIAQVGQLTGTDWFFLLSYRAGYFMILPVLVVWVWKRRFPIWGLIPLGLLFETGLDFGYRWLMSIDIANPLNGWLAQQLTRFTHLQLETAVGLLLALSLLVLLFWVQRRVGIPGPAWGALVLYLLAAGFQTYRSVQPFVQSPSFAEMPRALLPGYLFDLAYFYIYQQSGLLLMILIGALLSRRHGPLASLLPLGYLLPAVVYGRVSSDWPGASDPGFAFMLSVSATALAYRFLVALAGPLWIVRSASGRLQKRASTISLLLLVSIPVLFNLSSLLSISGVDRLSLAVELLPSQLPLAAAMLLALALYRAGPPAARVPARAGEEALPG